MPTLLFLTAGPYFWVNQRTVRLRYELLSKHFAGYIVSFVSRAEWRRATIAGFELYGRPISARTYNNLPLRLLVRIFFTLGTCLRLHVFKKRVDVIIAYDPFMTGFLGYLLSIITRAKLVVEVNNDFGDADNWDPRIPQGIRRLKDGWARRVGSFVLARADAVKLLYPGQLDNFYVGPDISSRTRCFHDFVPTRLFEPREPGRPYVLFVGHPWHRKGVDILLDAFNAISPDFPDVELVLIGYLPEKDRYTHLFEGNPRIRFVGPVMADDIIDWMAGCSLFVLPSRSEAMGRVLLEAMACAKPIIASRVSGIPHYIRDGETGLLFPKEDAQTLAQLMRTVLGDEALAARLGKAGHVHVTAHASDECYVEAVRSMVASLANRA